jgi:hypothetical protein
MAPSIIIITHNRPICIRTFTEKKARAKLFVEALRSNSIPAEMPNDEEAERILEAQQQQPTSADPTALLKKT